MLAWVSNQMLKALRMEVNQPKDPTQMKNKEQNLKKTQRKIPQKSAMTL